MMIEKHAGRSQKLWGIRAEDIHQWIDHYFDHEKYKRSVWKWVLEGWSPYEHRRHLHHREALPLALKEFRGKYPEELIENVFLQHLKDDYHGYIPSESDFDDPEFLKKYHRLFPSRN